MKKYLIVLVAAALSFAIVSCGNSTNKKQEVTTQNATEKVEHSPAMPANIDDLLGNYMGTYEGIIPCADCPGIDTKLTLNKDYTYSLSMVYQEKGDGKPFESSGSWKVNESFDIITLDFDKPSEASHYKIVDNNTIQMLDKEGKPIDSSLNYDLTK